MGICGPNWPRIIARRLAFGWTNVPIEAALQGSELQEMGALDDDDPRFRLMTAFALFEGVTASR
jgi:hypothetical protein